MNETRLPIWPGGHCSGCGTRITIPLPDRPQAHLITDCIKALSAEIAKLKPAATIGMAQIPTDPEAWIKRRDLISWSAEECVTQQFDPPLSIGSRTRTRRTVEVMPQARRFWRCDGCGGTFDQVIKFHRRIGLELCDRNKIWFEVLEIQGVTFS